MRRTLAILTATATLAGVALAAGCGGSDDSGNAASTTAPATTAPATTAPANTAPAATAATSSVAVELGKPKEFSLVPVPRSASTGKVTFVVKNGGSILHEMVVVPGTPESLRQPDGTASEAGTLGEVADVEPGKGGKVTVTMPAGTYTLLCNIAGHYAGGMYAVFSVK